MQPQRPRLQLRRLTSRSELNVADEMPPTRAQAIAGLARESIVWALAFLAGAGVYLAAVNGDPRWPQDYAGTLAAGATSCLMRMFPTTGSARRRR